MITSISGVSIVSANLREALAGNAIKYMTCLYGDGSAINIKQRFGR